jgi:magnesium transporter
VLRALSGQSPPAEIASTRLDEDLAQDAVWLDLLSPTEEERAIVERATGLRLPTQDEVSEVEASSRLIQAGEVLTLTTPMVSKDGAGGFLVSPLGFVLCPQRLVTLRYASSMTFDHFAAHWHLHGDRGGVAAFLGLLEAMVDRMADGLEHEGAMLDGISASIFGSATDTSSSKRRDASLRATLAEIGRSGDRVSHVRDGLLGVLRIVRFVAEAAKAWTREPETKRLVTLEKDLVSLNDYQSQLMGKVQFLLDATLGFISIEQNSAVKVLTVFSLVGIPPTLLAGIWGMNFKLMPELEWHYGYAYAWAIILLSAVVPLIWFKRKGWF